MSVIQDAMVLMWRHRNDNKKKHLVSSSVQLEPQIIHLDEF